MKITELKLLKAIDDMSLGELIFFGLLTMVFLFILFVFAVGLAVLMFG